jgi:hypothetical protein
MPKAAVDKDNGTEPPEHQIRFAGQLTCVQAVSEAATGYDSSDQHLWSRILAPDRGHKTAATNWTYKIHGISAPYTPASLPPHPVSHVIRIAATCLDGRRDLLREAIPLPID